jgi:hypothetical protein
MYKYVIHIGHTVQAYLVPVCHCRTRVYIRNILSLLRSIEFECVLYISVYSADLNYLKFTCIRLTYSTELQKLRETISLIKVSTHNYLLYRGDATLFAP